MHWITQNTQTLSPMDNDKCLNAHLSNKQALHLKAQYTPSPIFTGHLAERDRKREARDQLIADGLIMT